MQYFWIIISEGIEIGLFDEEQDAQEALKKYVKNGFVKRLERF